MLVRPLYNKNTCLSALSVPCVCPWPLCTYPTCGCEYAFFPFLFRDIMKHSLQLLRVGAYACNCDGKFDWLWFNATGGGLCLEDFAYKDKSNTDTSEGNWRQRCVQSIVFVLLCFVRSWRGRWAQLAQSYILLAMCVLGTLPCALRVS